MGLASLKFETLGDIAKLVFRGKRGKTSVDFTGNDIALTINERTVLKADSKMVSIPILQNKTISTEVISSSGKGIKMEHLSIIDNGVSPFPGVVEKTSPIKISSSQIIGTDRGRIGHSKGVTLVESPGEDTVLELVSATLIYKHKDAQYYGGGDDLVIKSGESEISGPTAAKDLICADKDSVLLITPMASFGAPLIPGEGLSLCGSEYEDLGKASGEIVGYITYRIINIGT